MSDHDRFCPARDGFPCQCDWRDTAASRDEAVREALEKAARIADGFWAGGEIARRIRALIHGADR